MNRADGLSLRFDDYRLGPGVDLLYRDSEVVPLEPRAARVLRYLAEHNDRVISKEELLGEIWSDVFTTDGVLKKAVSQIRRALADDADRSRFITTYHGRGYRFVAAVTRSAASTFPPPGADELTPHYDQLAGRDAEMATLLAELRNALEGHPRPVVLTGEPGIGKTQLTRHFTRRAIERGALPVYGRFFDYRGARLAPYELFIDLLRSAIGADRAIPLADAIESACGIRLPSRLFATSEAVWTGAGAMGDEYRFVIPICRCFVNLSKRQPLVVILDDVQWADPASLDLIGCLMRSLESEPLMLMMLIRSDDAENPDHPIRTWLQEHASRRRYTTLRLDRLDLNACRQMIGSIFRTRRSSEVPLADVEALHRLTDGNPYFLAETLRLLVTAGVIVPEASGRRWLWKGIRDLALPETIAIAARAKIEALPGDVRALVEHAAVIGDEFRMETLCRVAGIQDECAEQLLSEAVRRGVLTIHGLSPGEDCRFQHSIVRHVVYDSIPPFRRRQLHARAAEALEILYAADRDRVAEALAAHHWAAGDARHAFEAGMHAWRAASSRSEWRKALGIIERAQKAARSLEDGGNFSECERVELLIAAGETYRSVGRNRDAAAAIDRALTAAQSAGHPRALARAFFIRGLIHTASSSYLHARVSLMQALDLFLDLEDQESVARTAVQVAAVDVATGNYERAADLIESTLASSPCPDVVAHANAILGWSLTLMGRTDEGATLLERALEHHDRAGNLRDRATILRRLHWLHLSRGDYETAIALAVRARTDADTIGDTNGEAKANMGIGQARIAQGLYREGISFLTRAIGQLQVAGDAHCEAECLWQLGRAHSELGEVEEAGRLLERSLAMVREIGDRDDEFRIRIDRARLWMMLGDLAAARREADAASALAHALGNPEGTALAALEIARIDLAEGRAGVAREGASGAVAVLDARQSSERWRGWSILGCAERSAGCDDRARASLTKAVGFLDAIRNQIDSVDTVRRIEIARRRAAPARELAELLTMDGMAAEARKLAQSWML